MKKEDIAKFVLATVTSAVSGAAIALLMAPEKGSKTRKKITKKSDKYLKELKKDISELRQNVNNKAKTTKTEIDKISKDARKKVGDIVGRAKKITSYEEWTKDELYKRAKQRNVENYSTMNKAELIEALQDK